MSELEETMTEISNLVGAMWTESELQDLEDFVLSLFQLRNMISNSLKTQRGPEPISVHFAKGMIIPFETQEFLDNFIEQSGIEEGVDFERIPVGYKALCTQTGGGALNAGPDFFTIERNNYPNISWKEQSIRCRDIGEWFFVDNGYSSWIEKADLTPEVWSEETLPVGMESLAYRFINWSDDETYQVYPRDMYGINWYDPPQTNDSIIYGACIYKININEESTRGGQLGCFVSKRTYEGEFKYTVTDKFIPIIHHFTFTYEGDQEQMPTKHNSFEVPMIKILRNVSL